MVSVGGSAIRVPDDAKPICYLPGALLNDVRFAGCGTGTDRDRRAERAKIPALTSAQMAVASSSSVENAGNSSQASTSVRSSAQVYPRSWG
jgi:hypothetical protein